MNEQNVAFDGFDIEEYLKEIPTRGSNLGLDRMKEFMESIKYFDTISSKTKFIHVTGTNGKGSVSTMLAGSLAMSGYKVGTYNSPFLVEYFDSYRIYSKEFENENSLNNSHLSNKVLNNKSLKNNPKLNVEEISKTKFYEILEFIYNEEKKITSPLTEFEILTAAAFLFFKDENCDFVILECGMGGETDATNVLKDTFLSVITNVSLDHTGFLGESVAEIAKIKSGIIKNNRPVVLGKMDDEALKVFLDKSKECNSRVFIDENSEIKNVHESIDGLEFDYVRSGGFGSESTDKFLSDSISSETYKNGFFLSNLKLSLIGDYQLSNASTVLTAIFALRELGVNIPTEAIYSAFSQVRWPARMEVLSKDPIVIFDGSHNPDGINYTVDTIKKLFGDEKVIVVMGVMADKEYEKMVKVVSEISLKAYTITPDNPRALSAVKLAECFKRNGVESIASDIKDNSSVCEGDAEAIKSNSSVGEGVLNAIKEAKDHNLKVIILGSLYSYKDVIL